MLVYDKERWGCYKNPSYFAEFSTPYSDKLLLTSRICMQQTRVEFNILFYMFMLLHSFVHVGRWRVLWIPTNNNANHVFAWRHTDLWRQLIDGTEWNKKNVFILDVSDSSYWLFVFVFLFHAHCYPQRRVEWSR